VEKTQGANVSLGDCIGQTFSLRGHAYLTDENDTFIHRISHVDLTEENDTFTQRISHVDLASGEWPGALMFSSY
jgi:hypothetical protein